ncbi:MAG: hypothetical protein P8J87_04505, partial [Verrucomicrobiales bacterium]|nr:hypothetical protein [Verrucomicrobiales bacterium]
MAATEIGGFMGEAAAVAEGFTIVTLSEPDDDGNPVQLPASFNNTTWFDANDPQSASAGYQTIYVSGNGWASFLSASAVSNGTFPSFETGYDPVNSNMADINLLFGFHNADMVLDMVATKQVDQYFVIHIQWKDDYGLIFEAAGEGASEGVYPFPPYDPNADPTNGGGERKRDVKGDTRVPTQVLVTGELWLGLDGSVRMVYGKNPVAFGLGEDGKSNGFSQQTNGIYKAGAPVTEVMGTSLEFSTFATNPLYYGLETTLDGTSNTDKVFDWYVAYELGTTPFLTEAPEDGKVYGRKDGGWIEASAGGGDDSSGGAASGNPSGTPDYFAPQSRRMAQGLMPPFSNYSTADDSQAPIVRPKESLSAFFRYFQPGAQAFEDAGTWSLQPNNVIFFHSEDNALNSPFGFGSTASDLAVLTEIYQTNGQVLDPNFLSSNIVYIFATARFWREYPGTAEEWRYVSVDFHIPIDYTQSPTAASGYTALKLAEELFGTEEGEVTSFLDLIGCTQSELEGTHIPDPAPAIIQNHTADNSAVLEIYTRPVNSNTVNPGGGGEAKKREGRTNGPLDHNMPAGIPVQDGCVLVWREEPDVTQNLGSTGGGGGG